MLNASTDTQLWSQSYQRELRDLLTLQRELALTIANEIRVKLTPQEQERLTTAHPVNPAAHDAYLKANYLNTGTYEQRKKAREYYEQAIRLDPSYAPAYAGLADYYWGTPDRPAAEVMPKAKAYALKAIALDDSLADAHTALASVLFYGDWDWAGADREFVGVQVGEVAVDDHPVHDDQGVLAAPLGIDHRRPAQQHRGLGFLLCPSI